MEMILAITTNINTGIKLIPCCTIEEAIYKMKMMYNGLCMGEQYDYNNTYIDEEEGYAQIVEGLKQVEFRIGKLNEVSI